MIVSQCYTLLSGEETALSSKSYFDYITIDRYLRQPPNNKPCSIVGDSAFQNPNKVLNAICKQMMQGGKLCRRFIKILSRANNYNSCTKQGNLANGMRVEMFTVQRSDENELQGKFIPACFASRVQHRLMLVIGQYASFCVLLLCTLLSKLVNFSAFITTF